MADKRDVIVTTKMSKADLELLEKAAAKLWPDISLTRSTMLLSLAKLGARQAEKIPKERR